MAEVITVRCPCVFSSAVTTVGYILWFVTVSLLTSVATVVSSPTLVFAAPSVPPTPVIENIRAISSSDTTRVILTFSAPVPYRVAADPTQGTPSRLHLRFSPVRLAPGLRASFEVNDQLLKAVRVGQLAPSTIRVTLDVKDVGKYQTTTFRSPHQVVVILEKMAEQASASRQALLQRQRHPQSRTRTPAQEVPVLAPAPRAAARQKQLSPPPTPQQQKQEEKAFPRPPSPFPQPKKRPAQAPPSLPSLPSRSPMPVPSPAVEQPREEALVASRSTLESTEEMPELPAPPLPSSLTAEQHAALTVPSPSPSPLPEEREIQPPTRQQYRIVLDPGHGGTDPGARGVHGLEEKAVVLAVTKRLAEKLRSRLGVEVILTRTRDVFIPLPGRTARANEVDADLFVSIHANASLNSESRGIETYYLNNTNDRATIRLAKLENGIREKQQLPQREAELSYILSDLIQTGKEEESIALATSLQTALVEHVSRKYPDVRDLGVKKGPFYVLVGAHMPCVLVELSFLTHPIEGKNLGSRAYQDVLAEGLFAGIAQFVRIGLAETNL